MIKQLKAIKALVEVETGIDDISSRIRNQAYVDARVIFFYLAKKHTGLSHTILGDMVNRDHSSVTHALNVIYEAWITHPSQFKKEIDSINTIEEHLLHDLDLKKLQPKELYKLYKAKYELSEKAVKEQARKIERLEGEVKRLKQYEPIW